jgi:D-glycero-D-manno-heptose 1,7-bisphosphate phosphatase
MIFLSFAGSQSVSSKLLIEVPKPPKSDMGGSLHIAFVDRDGVINVERPGYVRTWEQFEFLPHALEGLALLARNSWRVVVITNQSAVNRGFLSADALTALHRRMAGAVAACGGEIAAIYACPHRPDEGCGCRKPSPGLLLAAARDFNISLSDVVFVGDQTTDLDAARRAGCRSILVTSGETITELHPVLPGGCDAVVPDLLEASRHLVERRIRNTTGPPTLVGNPGC